MCLKAGAVVGRKPGHAVHLPEPGHLPLGVVARVGFGHGHGLLAADLAPEDAQDVIVTEGAEGRSFLRHASLQEPPDLLDEAAVEHPFDAVVDAPIERLPLEPAPAPQDAAAP